MAKRKIAAKAVKRPARDRSKLTYLARRKKRVRELYEKHGLQSRDIAARLVSDGTIETLDESLESAIRLVRGDLAEIRKAIDVGRNADAAPTVAFNEVDALERELAELRSEHARQKLIADGEPTENCARSGIAVIACGNVDCAKFGHKPFIGQAIGVTTTNTPQGPMVSYKALWPAGVRQKASKDAALIAQSISKLEVALTEKRRVVTASEEGKAMGANESASRLFAIRTSGKPLNELIADNAGEGAKPN